jgi:phosphinothricin acetyltransferase
MRVRDATDADLPAILDLYNALVPTTTVAWTEELDTLEQRRAWLAAQHQHDFPVLVAEVDGEVVGFGAYGWFRMDGRWPGYDRTVEHSIHVAEPHWGTGVGRALLEALVERAEAAGLHVMVAAVDGDNAGSIAFHERLGFTQVARMPEVGHKFGRWLDLVFLQRNLDVDPP